MSSRPGRQPRNAALAALAALAAQGISHDSNKYPRRRGSWAAPLGPGTPTRRKNAVFRGGPLIERPGQAAA